MKCMLCNNAKKTEVQNFYTSVHLIDMQNNHMRINIIFRCGIVSLRFVNYIQSTFFAHIYRARTSHLKKKDQRLGPSIRIKGRTPAVTWLTFLSHSIGNHRWKREKEIFRQIVYFFFL